LRDNEGERLPSRESFGGEFESSIPAAIKLENVDKDVEGEVEACLNIELNRKLGKSLTMSVYGAVTTIGVTYCVECYVHSGDGKR